MQAAREGMPFFTKFPDSRLLARSDEPVGERGVLFCLSARLIDLIRTVVVAEIVEGTAFDATYAKQLLTFVEGMDLSGRPDFLWFSWNQLCTLPMPSWVKTRSAPSMAPRRRPG